MSNALALFMRRELTCIPNIFRHVSERYNNALGNILFWSFMLWLIVHILYDTIIDKMLRRMRYPEYYRNRMISNYWNFGFSFFTCLFCFVTLNNHDVNFTDLKTIHNFFVDKSERYVSSQYVLGFIVLSTFFLHTAFWEGNRKGFHHEDVYFNMTIVVFLFSTYMKGWCEVQLAIIGLYTMTQTALEISRSCSFQYQNLFYVRIFKNFWFCIHCTLCCIAYAFVIPLLFIIPCGRNMTDIIDLKILSLNMSLWALYCFTLYQSVIFKMVKHYVYHMNGSHSECKLTLLECCMFPRRTDTAYGVRMLKQEIERRQQMLIQQRTNPNKVALYQTLKCMVTMKRKLKQRRSEKSSDSDSSSSTSSENVSPSPSYMNIAMKNNDSPEVVKEVVDDMLEQVENNKMTMYFRNIRSENSGGDST